MPLKIVVNLLCFGLFFVASAHAQTQMGLVTDQTTIITEPAFPKPGEVVTATLNNYGSAVAGASTAWFFNGARIGDGNNQREVNVTVGELGETAVLEVVLDLANGGQRSYRKTITPTYLDIVVEPQTHVPGFYAGRALPSTGSTVNLTALVNTGTLQSTDYVYTWRVGREVLEGGAIRGRNTTSFQMPQGRDVFVSVNVAKPSGEVVADRTIILPSSKPELHFYEQNSLYGVSSNAIRKSLLLSNSASVVAEPYYLDTAVYNDPDIKTWTVAGRETTKETGNPYEVTFQKIREQGSTAVTFHVRDTTQLLQGVQDNFEIIY